MATAAADALSSAGSGAGRGSPQRSAVLAGPHSTVHYKQVLCPQSTVATVVFLRAEATAKVVSRSNTQLEKSAKNMKYSFVS